MPRLRVLLKKNKLPQRLLLILVYDAAKALVCPRKVETIEGALEIDDKYFNHDV